ncbi:hypothetical protein MTO96_042134 [Rhipicephalus appendiculatus]
MGAQRGVQVTRGYSPEHGKEQAEIFALRKENAELKEALQALRSEFELFRNSHEPRVAQSPVPVQAGGPNKRKAVSPPAPSERETVRSEIVPNQPSNSDPNPQTSLSMINETLNQVREAIAVQSNAIEHMDGNLTHLTRRVGILESKMKMVDLGKTNKGKKIQQEPDREDCNEHADSPQAMQTQ